MKVYIAANQIERAREAALLVGTVLGHEVVSDWHVGGEVRPFADDQFWAERTPLNLAKIDTADVVLTIPNKKCKSPGIMVESGYALGRRIPVIILGAKMPTSLLRHPAVSLAADGGAVEAKLNELEAVKPQAPEPVPTPVPEPVSLPTTLAGLPVLGVLDCRTPAERTADDAAGITLPPVVFPATSPPKRTTRTRAKVAAGV